MPPLALPFPSMDTLVHHASKGITPDRVSSQERLSLSPPPTPSAPPEPTMATTSPDPDTYATKLRGARTAFLADDFLTATKLAYQLLEDEYVPYWARAQAALIVTAYDAYPGNKPVYAEAVRIVEAIKGMEQEQVEPNYKSLQLRIEGKQEGRASGSSEETKPLRMEQSQIEGDIASRGLSGIDERDIGMALRKQDREELDGAGDRAGGGSSSEDKGEERMRERESNKNDSQDTDGTAEGNAVRKAKPTRDCGCIVI